MDLAVSSRGFTQPDASTLRERLGCILDTVERCIPVLGIQRPAAGHQAFKREKFVCETALFLYAAFRASDDRRLRRRCMEQGARLAPYARDQEWLALMTLKPGMIPELSVAHVCLTCMGLPDAAFDARLADLAQFGRRTAERVPWKDLEAAWLAARHALFPVPKGLATSVRRTTMVVGFDPLTATRQEMYAFTHGIIYFTDFGHQAVEPPRDLGLILRDAEAALLRCVDGDDFDLAAELLMVWPFFGVAMSPVARFCLQVLMGVEAEAGFLPSLTIRVADLAALAPDAAQHKLLDEAYHTVYVMGLLYAALLHGEARPLPDGDRILARPDAALRLPPRREGVPQWEQYYAALPSATRDGLGYFVVGVALVRTLQAHDLAGLHRILVHCCDGGAGYAPGVINAGEVIVRATRLAPA